MSTIEILTLWFIRSNWSYRVTAVLTVLVCVQLAPAQRVADNLIVLYEFDEGSGITIADTSGFGDPLNLTIDDAGATSWGAGTLTFEAPTIASNFAPATKVIDSVLASESITVEAWVQPESNLLFGAGRIAGVSNPDPAQAPFTRNFMLGQDGQNIDFRFRTTTTGDNGSGPQMQTDSTDAAVLDPPELMHIVGTRAADGTALIYVDGEIRSDTTQSQGGDVSNWDPDYQFTLGHEFTDTTADQRSWRGDYHLIAVYNRALSETEIAQNFAAGPAAGSDTVLQGDFNSDGKIDLADFNVLAGNFATDDRSPADGDINFDGRVDLADFVQFRSIFAAASGNAAATASVPEPTSIMLAVLGLPLLAVRRRRKRPCFFLMTVLKQKD